ncbi:MAG: thiol peroxidase [Gammaproteobacteria bacterium]|nr:thiol peroxidase [Gammaproteobacteria bacterium]
MANITLGGDPIQTIGELPAVGSAAPDFTLVKNDLSDVSLSEFKGKRVLLNISPSIDTSICADSVKRFNEEASSLDNTVIFYISGDLPFALERFCGAEGIENVITASSFRSPEFGQDYGLTMTSGAIRGLLARALVVVDEEGKVAWTWLSPEIAQDPDYDGALAALR